MRARRPIALPATCTSAIRPATISQCEAGVHRSSSEDGGSVCDLRGGARLSSSTLPGTAETVCSPSATCTKARAPHLLIRCDQLLAGNADVRSFRSGEARNGTSFGIEQMRNLARIIHDGSPQIAEPRRERRTEPGGPEAYSCSTLRVRWASPPTEGSSQQRIGDCSSRSVHE